MRTHGSEPFEGVEDLLLFPRSKGGKWEIDLRGSSSLYKERPLHNLVKVATVCKLINKKLSNSKEMSFGINGLNSEVPEDALKTAILGCCKSHITY
jgi:hypothetical protein